MNIVLLENVKRDWVFAQAADVLHCRHGVALSLARKHPMEYRSCDASVRRSVKLANPRRLGTIEHHPHYVTRRYAHFAASLLALHSGLDDLVVGIGGEEMLLNDLATLRVEVSPGRCVHYRLLTLCESQELKRDGSVDRSVSDEGSVRWCPPRCHPAARMSMRAMFRFRHLPTYATVCSLILSAAGKRKLQVVQLVQRMADFLPSKKLRMVFLINNYHEVRRGENHPLRI